MFFSPSPTPCGGSVLLLGETYTLLSQFNDSSPDYETFCFDIKEKSSGSTTSHSDLSLLEYESFHFDLSIDPLPSADRSDYHLEEFDDELAHIISPPEEVERFDPFFSLTQSGEKTMVMETPSFSSHRMPSSRLAAYSPKEVMTPSDLEDLCACFQSSNHAVSDHLY
ncbi:hypothetical protein Tco_1064203, partial [Tanacetum coccineum]